MKCKHILYFSIFTCLIIGCSSNNQIQHKKQHRIVQNSSIINYGNNLWIEKLNTLKKQKKGKFRIVQLGDSHTAGDYFSHTVRTKLQAVLGNGGIGLVPPSSVSGQRTATVQYQNGSWQSETSRKSSGDFPLGGVVAFSSGGHPATITSNGALIGEQKVTFNFKATPSSQLVIDSRSGSQSITSNSNQWQQASIVSTFPISYRPISGFWQLGQINIENQATGVVYSSLGINGARLSQNQKWRKDWVDDLKQVEPDLVILAYGTNEATDTNLDLAETEYSWRSTIQQIRNALPKAGILIIGAPESLKNTYGSCGERLSALDAMQQLQQKIAKAEKTAYWSWENAMGGRCSMKNAITQGLARNDGVHFSPAGYRVAATKLATDLLNLTK